MLNEAEQERYRHAISYIKNFNEKELNDYENYIFGSLNKKQRIKIEYRRLKAYLKNNPEIYVKYLDDIIEIEKLIKILNFDQTLEKDIYIKIVSIQIDTKQSIRLLSIIPKIKDELEYIEFSRNIEKNEKHKNRK